MESTKSNMGEGRGWRTFWMPIWTLIRAYLLSSNKSWSKASAQRSVMWQVTHTAQKMKFSSKDFFSKCDQIRNFLRIWSHFLKKSLMKIFIFFWIVTGVVMWQVTDRSEVRHTWSDMTSNKTHEKIMTYQQNTWKNHDLPAKHVPSVSASTAYLQHPVKVET